MDELIMRAKRGDQAALDEIYKNYKGLISGIANKYYLVGGDKQDLVQEGMLGLFYAIINFDETKGSFPNFVQVCVTRQIIDAVKSDMSDKNKPLSERQDISVAEALPDSQTPLTQLLDKELGEKALQILSPLELQVATMLSYGYSYQDIASKLNKSCKSVDCALQRARKKLQAQLLQDK